MGNGSAYRLHVRYAMDRNRHLPLAGTARQNFRDAGSTLGNYYLAWTKPSRDVITAPISQVMVDRGWSILQMERGDEIYPINKNILIFGRMFYSLVMMSFFVNVSV